MRASRVLRLTYVGISSVCMILIFAGIDLITQLDADPVRSGNIVITISAYIVLLVSVVSTISEAKESKKT